MSAIANNRWAIQGLPVARAPVARLVVAAGSAAAVWAVVQLGIQPFLPGDQTAYLLAALAVLVSAAVAGMAAGALTTALLALTSAYFWEAPTHSFRLERWQDVAQVALFLAVGLAISSLAGREARAKRAARDQGERFQQILEQSPLGVAVVGLDHRVLVANAALGRMFACAPADLVGQTFESLTHPDDVAADVGQFHRLLAGEIREYAMTKRYVRPAGDTFWGELTVATVRDGRGRPEYIVGMVQDVTVRREMQSSLERATVDAEAARRQAEAARGQAERAREQAELTREAAEAANRAKDEFLAVLSHELRTPLSPVLLTASSMETDPSLPPAAREGLHAIRQNVELEARLIDDLLDVTGIARGKLALHRESVDAHALIGQALYMVERDAAEKGVRVRADLGAPCADLDADATRLQQVFWNLLKNAVKFTPEGGEVVVRTACEHDPTGGQSLVVEVRDTGVGIAPDVLPRLFRAFEQGSSRVTRQFGGLGLGLAIARSIVELHGGRIAAASDGPGRGSTFTVRLPLAPARPPTPAPSTAPPAAHADGAAGRLRILLVEDHAPTRRAMTAILASLGHDVRAVGTLAEALAVTESADVDLVVSDLALPDGSGHDLMRRLKERRHDLHGVAVSGFGMEDDVRRSREAGFDEHLTKPVSRERIREALNHAVGA